MSEPYLALDFAGPWARFKFENRLKDEGRPSVYSEIWHSYHETSRGFYGTQQVTLMLAILMEAREHMPLLRNLKTELDTALEFALWELYVVFDARRADNFVQSAKKARIHAHALGLPETVAELSTRIIHKLALPLIAASDPEVFSLADDIMNAWAGLPPSVFKSRMEAHRRSYAHVPDKQYVPMRTAKVNARLKGRRMFHTAYFEERYGAQARKNLRNVIAGNL